MKTLPVLALCGVGVATLCYLALQSGDTKPGTQGPAVAAVDDQRVAAPESHVDANGLTPAIAQVPDSETGCTITREFIAAPGGAVIEGVRCDADIATEDHPYTTYPSDALESLAYADAKAAEILGMRLIEQDVTASLSLVIRAAALSDGSPAPVQRFSRAYPYPAAIDGVPQRQHVRVKFVLAAVVALLDGHADSTNEWEPLIREFSADPDRELRLLQARAREIITEMRQIQVDVYGASTIGGPGDA